MKYGPPAPREERVSRSPFIRDKGTKIGIGLIAAREFSPDYVMIFDADDFVHRDIAKFVHENPGQDGWYIDQGWMYSRGRSAYVPQDDFNRTCGTSFIMPFSAYAVPDALDVTASKAEVREGYGERISKIIGAHKWALEWYTDRGMDVKPLPFKGAVYHVDTGENHSRNAALVGPATPLTKEMAAEFGIPVRRGRIRTLWACYCSLRWAKLMSPFDPITNFVRRAYKALRRRVRRRLRNWRASR